MDKKDGGVMMKEYIRVYTKKGWQYYTLAEFLKLEYPNDKDKSGSKK